MAREPGDGRRALERIASRELSRTGEIAKRIFEALAAEVPAYRAIADERLSLDVRNVSEAGVRVWLGSLCSGVPPAPSDFEPIREGARRRARQGFDHHALLRAWRIAIRVMWSELINDPEARDPAVREVLPDAAENAMAFSDQVSLAVTDAYLVESNRTAREHERRRSALLELILSHPEEAVGLEQHAELARPHVVVVAETEELPLEDLDRVGGDLEGGAGAVFWTVRSRAVVAVIPVHSGTSRAQVVARLGDLIRRTTGIREAGVGDLAEGVDETRNSYIEAVQALSHGRALGIGGPIYDAAQLGSFGLLMTDPVRARRFVAAALRPLETIQPAPVWLEPTLDAYISRQGRTKEAALALGVHPNTIKYRLSTLRRPLGAILADPRRSGELLTALRLRRLLSGAEFQQRA
ncbi:MAG TPA: helix-turn-helix domain-containing protein [Candidatus Dormibacteraeota bacterium]|nr:helix-turn-helix domain-containing protein [Candidatus Dormibacteraeota bacterium]